MRIVWLVIFLSSTAGAENFFHGPLSSSMGGTGRAAMDSAEGAFLNPALLPLVKNYEMDGYFLDGKLDPDQHRHAYGLGAADNTKDVLFPGSLNYLRLRDTGRAAGAADGELIHVAIARQFNQNFSMGISGYRLTYAVLGDQAYEQWNYSLGALLMINQDMGFGYVLDNLAKPSSNVPTGLREDLQQGLGFFASLGDIARLRADITRNETNNPDHKMVYMLGFENLTSSWMIVRFGFQLDDQRGQRYLTTGAGLNGPRLKLDYSFQKNLYGTSEALHSVDMRLPF